MTDGFMLCLRGRMLEKFITHAVEQGVCFSQIKRIQPQEMHLTVCERDARILMALAEEYRMDMTVLDISGRPQWRRRFYERGTLLIGLLLGMTLIVLFLSRIWRIEVCCVDGAADAALLSQIAQSADAWGVKIGSERRGLDRDALSMFLQAQYPALTYVNVRSVGVILRIEIALEKAQPEVYDLTATRDLVAARDAVVVYVEVLTGQAKVKEGDTVKAGQLLIRGQERTVNSLMHDVRALGTVIARVWFTGECRLPLEQTVTERTGRFNSASELRLYGWTVVLNEGQDYPCQQIEEEYLPVGGMYLPLMIVRTTHYEARQRTAVLDEQLLKAQGEAYALEQAQRQMPAGAQQTAYWTEYSRSDGILTVRVTVEAQMDIAVGRDEFNRGD